MYRACICGVGHASVLCSKQCFGVLLPAKSRGGGVSTSECSMLSVESKPLERFGKVKMFFLFWAWNCANCKKSE